METKINSDVITYEDFLKVDLRVGSILSAVPVPKSTKLLQLDVSFGASGNRTILAGIGKAFQPEALIGTKVVVVFNLAPRQMMGIESHGMLLAGHGPDGALSLATCPDVPDGTVLG